MSDPVVSVIVVAHNSATDLEELLPLLQDARLEVVAVDNASTDDSVPICAQHGIAAITLPDNVGWARGCNVGARKARADVLAFVNPDARPDARALCALATHLDDRTATISPRFVGADGRPQPFYFRFPGMLTGLFCFLQAGQRLDALIGRPFLKHRTYGFGAQLPREVDQPGAACLLMKRATFCASGGFDERFFLFFSDTELLQRLHEDGARNGVAWDITVPHIGGTSVRRLEDDQLRTHFQRDYLQYVRIRRGRAAATLTAMAVLVLTGALPSLLRLVRGRPRQAADQLRLAIGIVR